MVLRTYSALDFILAAIPLPSESVLPFVHGLNSHPHSEYVFGVSKNLFDRLQDDQYNYWQEINMYYPFHDEGEWELAKFLVENLTQAQIDKFLKLKWFHTCPKPSFTSKEQLLDWTDALPSFVPWKVLNLEFMGYKTTYPMQLIWRDALEVVKQLFSNPVFANHITFQPHVVNTGSQCKYGDYMSANMAWKIKDYLPVGAMQVPIILGSDKTPVTQITIDGILYPPRTGKHTLQLIHEIAKEIDPWDLDKFQKAAKAAHLSGVHMPYWLDWSFSCPSIFLPGEFFADHPLKWIKEIVGKTKLNTHFITQHKWVGMHHFTKGIMHHCAAPPRFIHTIHALIDFFYCAQNPSMVQALSDFHAFKDAIIEAEARRGKKGAKEDFFIPKLKLLQNFRGMIERLVNDFTEQCVQILNCQESMELFNLYALITSHDEEVTTINPALFWISRILPDEAYSVHGPRQVHNHFHKGILSGDALTAFHLISIPDLKSLLPINILTKYALIDFDHAVSQFIQCSSLSMIMPSRVIQSYPPSNLFPLGNCDTILVNVTSDDGQITSRVAQVRLIFQPKVPHASNLVLPTYLSSLLLYIQYFDFIANPNDHPELTMWTAWWCGVVDAPQAALLGAYKGSKRPGFYVVGN
ncbi:hypothetical protein BDR06DRAFT_981335 [Suillus hirtellus]|nr:hypothetical protein BDR06DRAFT_981335 [Suillus hirtellus]